MNNGLVARNQSSTITTRFAYAFAFPTLSDWFKNLAPVYQHQNQLRFSRALSKLHGIVMNFDWFIALLAPAVVVRSNYFDRAVFN